jgi:predicted RNA binding protein with dsRBD fold (UPF0201 family)
MDEVEVLVEAEINPTEDEAKVKRAVENMFSNLEFQVKPQRRGSLLTARAHGVDGLTKLYNLLRRERIRDAARSVFYKGIDDDSIVFYLNKQVAYAGHVSFSQPVGESPLGPLTVKIQCRNPQEIIDWLAPRTTI